MSEFNVKMKWNFLHFTFGFVPLSCQMAFFLFFLLILFSFFLNCDHNFLFALNFISSSLYFPTNMILSFCLFTTLSFFIPFSMEFSCGISIYSSYFSFSIKHSSFSCLHYLCVQVTLFLFKVLIFHSLISTFSSFYISFFPHPFSL